MTIRASAEVAPGSGRRRAGDSRDTPGRRDRAGFTQTATSMAGDGTVLEQLHAIESDDARRLAARPGAPGSGQQLALIQLFVDDDQARHGRAVRHRVRAVGALARCRRAGCHRVRRAARTSSRSPLDAAVDRTPRSGRRCELVGQGWLAFDPVPAERTTDDESPPPPPSGAEPGRGATSDRAARRARQRRAGGRRPPSNPGRTTGRRCRTWVARGAVVAGSRCCRSCVAIGWHRGSSGAPAPAAAAPRPARRDHRRVGEHDRLARRRRTHDRAGVDRRPDRRASARSWRPPRRTRCAGWQRRRPRSRSAIEPATRARVDDAIATVAQRRSGDPAPTAHGGSGCGGGSACGRCGSGDALTRRRLSGRR